MRVIKIAGAVMLGFLAFLFIWAQVLNGSSDHTEQSVQPAQNKANEYSLEHKFAIVNAGKMIPETDPSVARARELLARAAQEYGIDTTQAADMSAKASEIIKNDGVNVSPMEVLEGATLAYVSQANLEFSKAVAMYIGLRKGGQPHSEAMMGMKGILQAITPH